MSEPTSLPAFFDAYPRFYETGNTGAGPRLNARHECLIEQHRALIEQRTILDVGSHDGRWSFAALAAGAKKVIGIEPRTKLAEESKKTLRSYGVKKSRFAFYSADALDYLRRNKVTVETVFLFGIFYHVHDHVGLVQELCRTKAQTILIDTAVSPDAEGGSRYANTVSLVAEKVDDISNSPYELYPGAGVALVGYPSRRAIRFLLEAFQFEVREVSWAPYLERWGLTGLEDYARGERTTFLARRI